MPTAGAFFVFKNQLMPKGGKMDKLKLKIKIEYFDVSKLKFYPNNPRIFGEKEIQEVITSFMKHGIIIPLLIDKDNVVLSGNLRLVACQRLKLKQAPVVKLDETDPKARADILLKMNILNGSWDYDLLRAFFDIDIILDAGFKDYELSPIFDDVLETSEDDWDTEKEIKQITEPKTRLGDIYKLGNHTLGCGSSTDLEFVKKVMAGRKADMIYTDTKFNIGLSYNKGIGGKSLYGGITDDNMSDNDYREFLKKTIQNGITVAKPDCHVFFYNDQRNIGLVQEIYKELGIENKRVCLWLKNGLNPTPGVAFNKSYEAAIYGSIGKPWISPKMPNLTEILNKEISTGNRQNDDILDMLDIWMVKRLAGQSYTHPTEKPVTLHEKALRRCTKINDVVLDLACGSFSTGIACEQLKRKCVTIDIDPIFCDLAIKRFETLTGQKAELISEGGNNGTQN